MNLLTRLQQLPWPFAAGAARAMPADTQAGAEGAAPQADTPIDADDDIVRGCGWFDSSHELQQGLLVREHGDASTLGAEMPLGPWLDLHLGHWRPALAV